MNEEGGSTSSSEVPEGLFRDVKFYLIGSIDNDIKEALVKGGAKKDDYLSDMVTHAIADDDTEDDYCQAKDLFEIPVVNSKWVVMSIKCGCLLPINGFSPESNQIFTGVVACPSQLSTPDCKSVWALLSYYGGTCRSKLNKYVTHLITADASGGKYAKSLDLSSDLKVVHPDWVMESVDERKRLPEKRYHPRLLLSEEDALPNELNIKQEADDGIPMELDPYGMPMSPPMAPPTSTNLIFKSDSTRAKEALARMVTNRLSQGGKEKLTLDPALLMKNQMNFAPPPDAVVSPPPMPMVPPPLRPPMSPRIPGSPRGMGSPRGPRSPRARGQGSPRSQGSPRGQLRNITNNAEGTKPPKSPRGAGRGRGRGNAKVRADINQLVNNLNRPLQPFMPGPLPLHMFANQIAPPADLAIYYGHDPSESVPDDLCLIGCVFYVTDYHKYLEAQEMDNWKTVIEQHGGQVDDSYSNRVTHVLCEHQKSDVFQLALRDGKRVVTAHWLNDCLLLKRMQPPWLALHFPSVYAAERPCKNQIICVTNFDGEERTRVKHMISVMGAKYTGYMTHANSVVIAKFPVGTKFNKACDWRIPVVNVQWLNDILLGDLMALKLPVHTKYQQFNMEDPFKIIERWRVGHLLEGWKAPIKVSKEAWKRFNPSQLLKSSGNQQMTTPTSQGGSHLSGIGLDKTDIAAETVTTGGQKRKADEENSEGLPAEKKHCPEDVATGVFTEQQLNGMDSPAILMTGITRKRVGHLSKEVERLGGSLTATPKQCTHLVVNCLVRTIKFFAAFGVAKYVVTPDWISQSAKAGKFLDEADFLLKDEKAESMFSFNMQESLRRARERKLFQDMAFYITPSVQPGMVALKEIVENSGGRILDKRPTVKTIMNSHTPQGKPRYAVITCENDFHLCVELTRRKIAVHNIEFILTGLVQQKIDFKTYRFSLPK